LCEAPRGVVDRDGYGAFGEVIRIMTIHEYDTRVEYAKVTLKIVVELKG
jgi:hypothetical protein